MDPGEFKRNYSLSWWQILYSPPGHGDDDYDDGDGDDDNDDDGDDDDDDDYDDGDDVNAL